MKQIYIRTLAVLVLGFAFNFLPNALHANEEGHEAGAGEPLKIPDTITGVWQEIQEHKEELNKIIKDKKLSDVHKTAFAIRDFAKALPDKSKDLPEEKLQRLKSAIKQIEKLAADLDESGDANNQAATEANFKKLEGALKLIEAQYPSGALGSKSAASYTCPMHPNVVAAEPGKCPQCGMNLEKKAS